MPYDSISVLPLPVREHLPKHAQEIWMDVFNSADRDYGEESRAARAAWAAVKRNYHKTPRGQWVKV